jgi:putative autoinducer-2 (AI-2) aldolase
MLTRGILRSIVPPATQKPIVLRVSGGTSILKELSNEEIAVDIEESIRLNVCAMAVQVFIGGEFERQSIINMTKMVDIGTRYGIPTLAVTAVGKDMARDARYFRLATRICAELITRYSKEPAAWTWAAIFFRPNLRLRCSRLSGQWSTIMKRRKRHWIFSIH